MGVSGEVRVKRSDKLKFIVHALRMGVSGEVRVMRSDKLKFIVHTLYDRDRPAVDGSLFPLLSSHQACDHPWPH